jgi:hypothetical protein
MKFKKHFIIRWVLTICVVANFALIFACTQLHPAYLSFPGAISYALQPVTILFVNTVLILTFARRNKFLLQNSFTWGVISGIVEITHIIFEHYDTMEVRLSRTVTIAFMLVLFISWCAASYQGTKVKASFRDGILSGMFSAMVCMLLVVAFGLSQLFWFLPQLMKHNIGSPDLLRSGWTDLKAFTIADIFQSGFKVLLIGPILGGIFGALGTLPLLIRKKD